MLYQEEDHVLFLYMCRYGVGYRLVMVKQAACNSTQVTELVKSFVDEAQQVTDVGAELSFLLPSSSSSNFPSLFNTLEGIHK